MTHVRSPELVASAVRASDQGVPDAENAARHGVAVSTVRRWRRLYQRRGRPRGQTHLGAFCPRCDGAPLDEAAYAELLGWYLGDGFLTQQRRGVQGLHVVNDLRYPATNARVARLMTRVKPGGRPHTRVLRGCLVTTVSWKHWTCLFPQHGPGRKHTRDVSLHDWQEQIVLRHPGPALRGLFHSDGCRTVNRVVRRTPTSERRYEYPRWQFSNRSEDIHALCAQLLDQVGVAWRRSGHVTSVSRASDVERLDDLVGAKD